MYSLPPKASRPSDMLNDAAAKSARLGPTFDVERYQLWKFGRGGYSITPKPPVRPSTKIGRK
jgi:hypothetical protein